MLVQPGSELEKIVILSLRKNVCIQINSKKVLPHFGDIGSNFDIKFTNEHRRTLRLSIVLVHLS